MNETIIGGHCDIRGGTETLVIRDHRGDVWERVKQLPFIDNRGNATALYSLAMALSY